MFIILLLSECTLFLLNPSFFIFILALTKMVFFFYYMLKIRQYRIDALNFKRLFILVFPAIVFSIILFYTFPRFTQGFMNAGGLQAAFTGGNTQFSFKNLGPLNPSTEPVFKVYGIANAPLNHSLLYWRSNLLWEFVNQEWRGGFSNLKTDRPEIINPQFKYSIYLVQKNKEFLPTLDGTSIVTSSKLPVNYYLEGSHRLKVMTRADMFYTVKGNYADRAFPINPLMIRKGLRLKSGRINEVSNALLKGIDRNLSDELKLKELIQVFKMRQFQYSLNPPTYNSLEEFIISGKQGYCSHFAAAFTYLARALFLPTRIVVGYLGGELNPFDDSVIIREQDAHSWVEVFLSQKGWVRVDPTAFVVPSRLQMSAGDFNQKLNPYLTLFNIKVPRNLFEFSFLKNLSLWLDSINSRFGTNVLNFDRDEQAAFIKKISPFNLSAGWIFSLMTIFFLLSFYFLFLLLGRTRATPAERRYRHFLKKMKRLGLEKLPHETASSFKIRCLQTLPEKQAEIEQEISQYIDIFYR